MSVSTYVQTEEVKLVKTELSEEEEDKVDELSESDDYVYDEEKILKERKKDYFDYFCRDFQEIAVGKIKEKKMMDFFPFYELEDVGKDELLDEKDDNFERMVYLEGKSTFEEIIEEMKKKNWNKYYSEFVEMIKKDNPIPSCVKKGSEISSSNKEKNGKNIFKTELEDNYTFHFAKQVNELVSKKEVKNLKQLKKKMKKKLKNDSKDIPFFSNLIGFKFKEGSIEIKSSDEEESKNIENSQKGDDIIDTVSLTGEGNILKELQENLKEKEFFEISSSCNHWSGNFFGSALHNFQFQELLKKNNEAGFIKRGCFNTKYFVINKEIEPKIVFENGDVLVIFNFSKGDSSFKEKKIMNKFSISFIFEHYVGFSRRSKNMHKLGDFVSFNSLYKVKCIHFMKRGKPLKNGLEELNNYSKNSKDYFDMAMIETNEPNNRFNLSRNSPPNSIPFIIEKENVETVLHGFSLTIKEIQTCFFLVCHPTIMFNLAKISFKTEKAIESKKFFSDLGFCVLESKEKLYNIHKYGKWIQRIREEVFELQKNSRIHPKKRKFKEFIKNNELFYYFAIDKYHPIFEKIFQVSKIPLAKIGNSENDYLLDESLRKKKKFRDKFFFNQLVPKEVFQQNKKVNNTIKKLLPILDELKEQLDVVTDCNQLYETINYIESLEKLKLPKDYDEFLKEVLCKYQTKCKKINGTKRYLPHDSTSFYGDSGGGIFVNLKKSKTLLCCGNHSGSFGGNVFKNKFSNIGCAEGRKLFSIVEKKMKEKLFETEEERNYFEEFKKGKKGKLELKFSQQVVVNL